MRYSKLLEYTAIGLFGSILLYFIVTCAMSYFGLDAGWPYPQHWSLPDQGNYTYYLSNVKLYNATNFNYKSNLLRISATQLNICIIEIIIHQLHVISSAPVLRRIRPVCLPLFMPGWQLNHKALYPERDAPGRAGRLSVRERVEKGGSGRNWRPYFQSLPHRY